MAALNKSQDDPNRGFAYAADNRTALRQFRVSLGVVVVLGVAILAAALNLRTSPIHDGASMMLSFVTIQAARPLGLADRS